MRAISTLLFILIPGGQRGTIRIWWQLVENALANSMPQMDEAPSLIVGKKISVRDFNVIFFRVKVWAKKCYTILKKKIVMCSYPDYSIWIKTYQNCVQWFIVILQSLDHRRKVSLHALKILVAAIWQDPPSPLLL